MRNVVTIDDVMRNVLMMTAATVSSRLVPRMRPSGRGLVSSEASPRTCGITATPVSKPDRPSASFGNTISAMPIITRGLLCCAVRPLHQSLATAGRSTTCQSATPTTTALRTR